MSTESKETDFFEVVALGFVYLALGVFLLPALAIAAALVLLARRVGVKWWHILIPSALALGVLLMTGKFYVLSDAYLQTALAVARGNVLTVALADWFKVFGVSVVFGLLGASFWLLNKEDSQPEVKAGAFTRYSSEETAGASGWKLERERRKAEQLTHQDGVALGVERGTLKPVFISDREANQHCFVVGTTGAGKTTTITNFAESAISRGIPLVVVDGKGDIGLAEDIRKMAERHGRQFKHFSTGGDSWRYNPFKHGGPTEVKDKLINLTEWTEEHYYRMAERYLQAVFWCLQAAGVNVDLSSIAKYINKNALASLARQAKDKLTLDRILSSLDSIDPKDVAGLAHRVAVLAESEVGQLLREKPDNTIDLVEVIQEGQVAVFSLESLRFPEFARLLGRLVVADLKTVAVRSGGKPVYIIFDEFSVFATPQVVDMISKTRSFGFRVLIGTQSPSDLEAVGGQAMVEQVIENTNTYIIHRQNSGVNAEKLAGVIGTKEGYETTYQVQSGSFGSQVHTGMGTRKLVREFIVHPDEIKRLETGEAILVRKSRGFMVQKVRVRKPASGGEVIKNDWRRRVFSGFQSVR